jgi:hypothetical protein
MSSDTPLKRVPSIARYHFEDLSQFVNSPQSTEQAKQEAEDFQESVSLLQHGIGGEKGAGKKSAKLTMKRNIHIDKSEQMLLGLFRFVF